MEKRILVFWGVNNHDKGLYGLPDYVENPCNGSTDLDEIERVLSEKYNCPIDCCRFEDENDWMLGL